MRVMCKAVFVAGIGLTLVGGCAPPADEVKAPVATAKLAEPPPPAVTPKPAVKLENQSETGGEEGKTWTYEVAKEVILFTAEHGDVYTTSYYGIGQNPQSLNASPLFGADHDSVAVLIGGDGKEPFSGILMINCDADTSEWLMKSEYGAVPEEVAPAARKEFCPQS